MAPQAKLTEEERRERQREHQRRYYERHKKEVQEKQRQYRETHREEIRATARAWAQKYYATHSESLKKVQKKYRDARKEWWSERYRAWYEANKDRRRESGEKWYAEHREQQIERATQYGKEHPEQRKEAIRKWAAGRTTEYRRAEKSKRRQKLGLPESVSMEELEQERKERQNRFLTAYRNAGVVRIAVEAAGISRTTYYQWKEHDPEFLVALQQAKDDAADLLEMRARQRALTASDNLLMFLLRHNRPEVYGERINVDRFLRTEAQRIAAEYGVEADEIINDVEEFLHSRKQGV